MRRAAGKGHGVVDIAHRGITSGPPAREITPADELGQRRRRPIPRLDLVAGHHQWRALGVAGLIAHRLGGLDPETGQITGRGTPSVDGGLLGQQSISPVANTAASLGNRSRNSRA